MTLNKPFLFLLLLASITLSSCSGVKDGFSVSNGSTATLSVTMRATPLTPPPGTNILSFTASINEVSLTPTTGTAQNLSPTAPFDVDFTQLQSDSVFLGKLTSVPVGTYTVSVSLSAPVLYYCTQPNPGTPGCVAGSIAKFTGASQVPVITSTLTLTANQQAGIALNFNLQNALTVNASQAVTAINFTLANALTFNTLPGASTSLAAGHLDFIEDLTGVVTAATSPNITISTATRGALTVATTSNTVYSPAVCSTNPTFAGCVVVGQVASIDAALNSDGTLTALEYDPLPLTPTTAGSDIIEGVVTATPASNTQFQIVANNLVFANSGSLIRGSLNSILGAPITVNLGAVNSFLVDSRGLDTPSAAVSVFTGSNNASILLPGQTVAVHINAFTAAAGNTPATATADALMLRFSRVSASISTVNGSQITLQNLPPFYGITSPQLAQLSAGNAPTSPSTNFDGTVSGSIPLGPVSIRALYLGSNAAWAFTAAKVRIP